MPYLCIVSTPYGSSTLGGMQDDITLIIGRERLKVAKSFKLMYLP